MLIHIGPDTLQPTNQVRDLRVYFDAELNMKAHIRRVAGACYYHLQRLRALRGLLSQEVTALLVSAFVLSRLDYCNAVLTRLPASTLAPLQRVMHAAACLVWRKKLRRTGCAVTQRFSARQATRAVRVRAHHAARQH